MAPLSGVRHRCFSDANALKAHTVDRRRSRRGSRCQTPSTSFLEGLLICDSPMGWYRRDACHHHRAPCSVFRVYPYSGTVKNQGLHIQKYPQAKRDESCRPWLRPGDHGHGASYQQAMEIGRASGIGRSVARTRLCSRRVTRCRAWSVRRVVLGLQATTALPDTRRSCCGANLNCSAHSAGYDSVW